MCIRRVLQNEIIKESREIKQINDRLQGYFPPACNEWHSHENIDDKVHNILTELGD